ncbi:hypothetical protein Tco_0879241 [Tanacetum coccineum]
MVVLMMFYSIRIMDPNSSLRKICLGDDVIVISSDKVERLGDWNSLEYQDTTISIGKKVMNALNFYRMETDEISERYIALCFVNSLEAFDGEVNLKFDENLISNEFAVKLCLDYEVKKGKKLVKKKLIVALKGQLYFVKFIINPEEDDFEPGVILGRFILRTPPPSSRSYDWDQLLDFNFDDVPKSGEELPPFVRKMGKSNLEERAVIETLAYNDKYRRYLMNLKERWNLMNKTVKENEEAVKRIKGGSIEGERRSWCIHISYQIGGESREDLKKVDRGITMINHTQAEAMGKLSNVLCQSWRKNFSQNLMEFVHQPSSARFDVLRTAESDSDDEEEYVINRNQFGSPIYGPRPAPYLNCTNSEDRSSAIQIKPNYKGSYTKEEEATGQWRTEIRLTDPYGNIYPQRFTTKKTD